MSRVLSVAVKGDKVCVELRRGPGKVTPTGASTPNGRPETAINVGFAAHQARRMAAMVSEAQMSAADTGENGRPVTRKGKGLASGKTAVAG